MKIGLNMGKEEHVSSKEADNRQLQKAIAACKKGDWAARTVLGKMFQPWLKSLAEKRAGSDSQKVNELIEAGTDALCKAAKKYKLENGAHGFRVFAVPFVEGAMDNDGRGFLAKLFGKR